MPIPEEIKALKPTDYGAVEIRCISGHFYVYEISSKWDPAKGKARKVTGKSVGKITLKDGFVPNEYGTRQITPLHPLVKNYGAYAILQQLSGSLEKNLRDIFPDIYREISVVAMLQLVTGCRGKRIKREFEASCLNDIHPDLSCSDYTVRSLIGKLGIRNAEMAAFMRLYVKSGSKLMFDGTSIFTRADDSFAQRGYNPDHKKQTQVRLLYIFDRSSYTPVFYRMISGNVADKAALKETIAASGCKNCIVIGDKGFYSKKNVSFLMDNKMTYILPLQYNTKLIPGEFAQNKDDHKFDGCFVYKGRNIWHKTLESGIKGNKVYIFRDDKRKLQEEVHFMQKKEADYEGTENSTIFDDDRRGMIAFVSNTGETAKQVYMSYRERWDVEQCLDYLKNSVQIGASHKRTNEELEAWSFINHVSLLYFYGLVKVLREQKLNEKYSPEDILSIGRNIYLVREHYYDKESRLSEVPKKDKELLETLGVKLI
ncbi:MAG: transposase [Clostridiales bacterium]|nr:transposase [Clostridiales bacterium]